VPRQRSRRVVGSFSLVRKSDTPSASPLPAVPSDTPSFTPSFHSLSGLPSVAPTSTPTAECHDSSTYESPINNFTCLDHNGTDCTSWKALGLNVSQVKELVESCPISCRIPCGSFLVFDVPLSYRLVNVENFLDAATASGLERATAAYLTTFVLDEDPNTKFFVDKAELKSQEVLSVNVSTSENLPDSTRSLRQLNQERESPPQKGLLLSMMFLGFGVGMTDEMVGIFLSTGINAPGYAHALKVVNPDLFSNLQVQSGSRGHPPLASPTAPAEHSGPPTGAIATVFIFTFLAFALSIVCLSHVLRKRRQTEMPDKLASPSSIKAVRSLDSRPEKISTLMSFDSGVVGSLARLVASSSPRSRAPSTCSDESTGKDEEISEVPSAILPLGEREESPVVVEASIHSDQCESPAREALPIPPIFVFDNIELDDGVPSTSGLESSQRGPSFPLHRIQASPELVAAINNGSYINDPSIFYMESQLNQEAQHQRKSNMDFDNTSSSQRTHVRRSSRTNEHSLLRVNLRLDAMGISDSATERPPRPDRPPMLAAQSAQFHSGIMTHSLPQGRSKTPPRERTLSNDSTVRHKTLPVGAAHEPEKVSSLLEQPTPLSANPFSLEQPWQLSSFSPFIRREPNRQKHGSNRHLKEESEVEEPKNEHKPEAHVFHAPRRGKMGLVVESSFDFQHQHKGPVITRIKDYSPLLGSVEPGDILVKFDGVDTSKLSIDEVSQLLANGKSNLLSGPTIRLVVHRRSPTTRTPSEQKEFQQRAKSLSPQVSEESKPTIPASHHPSTLQNSRHRRVSSRSSRGSVENGISFDNSSVGSRHS
jgi:hypothetical protein